ncbi:UDP-4-amino-4,6-dideoxy-N-acetyl-beta-L-altrosamine N-acetyltransferase [Paraglaciecola sp.]|uniref:UDP-4-amino-4, 6-dideoxy-N-acetyl-beta-L-altrosamine N-acetyltransferase n=1 Tax=Paraglaciecola sp. TaxID=1920173 RepID=UPI003EF2873D
MSYIGIPQHEFKQLSENELKLVWQWRNSPRIQNNMHNNSAVSWEDHCAWFKKLQGDPNRIFFVLWQNQRPIGVLNFSELNTEAPEWGCYLGETNVWPGSGIIIEVAALDFAARVGFCDDPKSKYKSKPFSHLLAQVLSFNDAANKMHKIFEYEQVSIEKGSERDGQPFDILHYSYDLNQWQDNRPKVLAKLPQNIKLAADQIQFLEKETF